MLFSRHTDTHHHDQQNKHTTAKKPDDPDSRGLIVVGGGRYYLPQAIVLLRILRHELRSTLPVELFWYGDDEMDEASFKVRFCCCAVLHAVLCVLCFKCKHTRVPPLTIPKTKTKTIKAIAAELGPLRGGDLAKLPYPAHHLQGARLKGFPLKPYAVRHSSFKQALLLDCDVVLASDPAPIFDAPGFKALGNYFWADIYGDGMFDDAAYAWAGLNAAPVKAALKAGKGDFDRLVLVFFCLPFFVVCFALQHATTTIQTHQPPSPPPQKATPRAARCWSTAPRTSTRSSGRGG